MKSENNGLDFHFPASNILRHPLLKPKKILSAPLLQPEPKDEVEWDGDGEVDVTVDLEENSLVEIEVRWKPELGRRPVRFLVVEPD